MRSLVASFARYSSLDAVRKAVSVAGVNLAAGIISLAAGMAVAAIAVAAIAVATIAVAAIAVPGNAKQTDVDEWAPSPVFPGKGSYNTWVEANRENNVGLAYCRRGLYARAIARFKTAIQKYPFDFAYYGNLGSAYRLANDLPHAEESTRQAIKLNSRRWGLWQNLGKILVLRDRNREARYALQRSLKLNPPLLARREIKKLLAAIEEEMGPEVLVP